jgi:hypothetical protein
MKHTMSTPCKHCPFRKNIAGYLRKERVVEIAHSVLRGETFPCHKITEEVENEDGNDMEATEDSQECAGAAIFAHHNGMSSQMSRISERLRMPVAKLNLRSKVCKTVTEMVKVHCGEDFEEGETCEVVNDGCLAPAGYMVGNGVAHGTEFVTTTCDECGQYVCDNCSKTVDGKRICDHCEENEE